MQGLMLDPQDKNVILNTTMICKTGYSNTRAKGINVSVLKSMTENGPRVGNRNKKPNQYTTHDLVQRCLRNR